LTQRDLKLYAYLIATSVAEFDAKDSLSAPKSPGLGEQERIPCIPLTIIELRTAASFLRQAKTLVESVKDFFRGYDTGATARLGHIVLRISNERDYVERLISKAPNGSARNG
jgi:hypothetical protein